MSKKLFLLTSFALLSIVAGNAFAGDINWNNAGGDGLWSTPGNWSTGAVPTLALQDKAKMVRLAPNDAHINAGMAAECTWLVVGDTASGEIHMTGGTLNISGPVDSWTIIAYASSDIGIFTMDGGTVTTSNRVFVGFGGDGTLNMNGGTMNIGGTFGIGYGEGAATSRGRVNLYGGTINVTGTFYISNPSGGVGKLDITGGSLVLTGNKKTQIDGYVTSGLITAFNGLGDVMVNYNGTNTIVTGVTNVTKARGPSPANSTSDAPPYAVLKWTAGNTAVAHDVYFGTDANSVRDANTSNQLGVYRGSQALDANSYTPAGLELGKAYFWRIDEVADANFYKGNLWQFVVAPYALIDDIEKYTDTAGLLAAWSNGGTGATLSLAATGGHDKAKTMKFDYDNRNTPLYSEAQTGGPTVNWTVGGVVAMDIWYKGDAANAAVPMYAALEDNDGHPVAVLVNSDPAAAQVTAWTVWHVKLSDFSGVNLANVKKLYVGFGDRANPVAGGVGTVYIDDIKLYQSRCIGAPTVDLNADCVVDFNDFAIMASNWMQVSTI